MGFVLIAFLWFPGGQEKNADSQSFVCIDVQKLLSSKPMAVFSLYFWIV